MPEELVKIGSRGQLLLEILLAVAALAIVGILGSQLLFLSLRSNKSAAEKNVGLGIAEETFETARVVAGESWQNLYGLTKYSESYYPQKSAGEWIFTTGTENVIINDTIYTRYFTAQNVCRDTSTKSVRGVTDQNGTSITCAESGGSFDPSTQKINVKVTWPNADVLSFGEYFTRWQNNVCLQTSWQTSGSSGPKNCPDTSYESASNLTVGSTLQISQ